MSRVIWGVFWVGVLFALAHVWGWAALFLFGWVVLWVGRGWLAGRR